MGSGIFDAGEFDIGASTDKDVPTDDSQPFVVDGADAASDAFLDVGVEAPEGEVEEEVQRRKIKKHVRHVKARCWSAISSAMSILHLARKSNVYFNANYAESHMNLTPMEYADLSHVLGVLDDIVDLERYSEGAQYDTSSIFHPITLQIRQRLAMPTIWCPDPHDAEGEMVEVAVECMGRIGKQCVASAISELNRCFGETPSTLVEAKTIYCDPRLKAMAMYTQRDVETGKIAIWQRARDAIKRDIADMVRYDRAAERARMMHASVRDPEPVAPKTTPVVSAGGKRKKPSLGSSAAGAPPAPAATAAPPVMLGVRRPEEIAEDECLWWDQVDDLAECQRDLMPTAENPTVLKVPEYHLEHMHVKKGPAYFHRAALACGGRNASAAETERYFRAVAFVNSLGRQGQKPSTIARLSFLHRNRDALCSAKTMVAEYKRRMTERRAAVAREKEEARVARNAAASASAADSDAMAVVIVEVVDVTECGVSEESWDGMLAGLDSTEVGDWVDGDFAAAASTTGGEEGDVVALCERESDSSGRACGRARHLSNSRF